MRVLAATATALLLVTLSAAAASAAPARSGKLTGPEEKWVNPVLAVWNVMNSGLLVVDKQMKADAALIPGTKTNKALITTLGNFVSCSPAMTKAKAPPTKRLGAFASSMKSACSHLGKGAHGVANGISTIYKQNNAKLATLQFQAARKEFVKGSAQLANARTQLVAIAR